MQIEKLKQWLSRHGIEATEDRQKADGSRVITFVTELPNFPHGGRKAWCSLPVDKGQSEISESEIQAILRHCWHSELEIPPPGDGD